MNVFAKTSRLALAGFRRFLFHPGEALLMCRMAWWVAFLSTSTRFCTLPRALELVSGRKSVSTERHDIEVANSLARTVDLLLGADVLFLRPICWKRAAVLRRYLSKQGMSTQIVFGVRKELKNEVDGHAWLEFDGQPFLEKIPPEYVVTYTFPSNERREPQLAFTSK